MLTTALDILGIGCLVAFALIVWPPLILPITALTLLGLSYAEPWKRGGQ